MAFLAHGGRGLLFVRRDRGGAGLVCALLYRDVGTSVGAMTRAAVLVLALMAVVLVRAEPQTWVLTDGRTVAVVKVLSQTPTHVTVRTEDGLQQIDKRQLPEALRAQFPYDEAGAAALAAARAKKPLAEDGGVRRVETRPRVVASSAGVTILNVRPAGPAIAYLMLANNTPSSVEVGRDLFVAVTAAGLRFPSHHLTNPRGDLLTRVRIEANSTAEIGVVFAVPEGESGEIGEVFWRPH